MERVYRLQVEFCEVSLLLARPQTLELQDQLLRRRMMIIAEASDLIHKTDAGDQIERVSGLPSQPLHAAVRKSN